MRAQYALALSRLYHSIKRGQTTEEIRKLYSFVYMQIYAATRAGETRATFRVPLGRWTEEKLVSDGFTVITEGDTTMVDWTVVDVIVTRAPVQQRPPLILPITSTHDLIPQSNL